MISGAFHPASQEWRYYSREKSLIHTLHLAQLVSGSGGDTVLIESAPPAAHNSSQGFSVPPLNLPLLGGGGIANVTFTKNVLSQCFGSAFGQTKSVVCHKNMDIQFGVWDDFLKEIIFTPQQPGWFLCHAEFTSGLRGFEVSASAQQHFFNVRMQRFPGTATSPFINSSSTLTMDGTQSPTTWRSTMYLSSILNTGYTDFIVTGKGTPVRASMINTSTPANPEPGSYLSAFMFKVAEP